MSEDNGTTTIETKWGKISGKRTAELVSIILLCVVAVGVYAFYQHDVNTKTHQSDMREVLRDISTGIRESNCINTYKEEQREAKSEHCKRMSK